MRFFPFRPNRAFVAALAGLPSFSSGVHAQRVVSTLDVGGVGIQYADTLSGFAGTVTPRLTADWGNRVADLNATYSQFSSAWSLQGQASGSVFTPISRLLGELAGSAGGSTHQDGSRTGELLLNARLHAQQRLAEWFIGIGGGQTFFGEQSHTLALGEAGVSVALATGDATLVVTPVAMGDSIRYADGQVNLSWQRRNIDFAAVAGARVGDQLTSLGGTARAWGNISVTAWPSSRAAVVLSGGTYPIDPTQGFPGGRFVALGIRLTQRRRAGPTVLRDSPGSDASVLNFSAEKSQGIVTFKVLAPLARNVELAADFTEWEPVQMAPVGNGWWSVSHSLSPGKYQINLRLNGGKWVVPPGLLAMLDEFGGSVGLLVVE